MDGLAAETCDVCGARAYVRTIITPNPERSLTWCGHHFVVHELAIMAEKYPVIDRRFELEALVRPAKPRPAKP